MFSIIKNKKATHVEEILAFVFFITFVMFLLFFLKYPHSENQANSALSMLESSVYNQTTGQIEKAYITNESVKNSENCISVNESYLENTNINVSVKGSDGSNVKSKRDSGILYIDWSSNPSFFSAFYSENNFSSEELTGILSCQTGEIKTVYIQKIFLEQKIENLINKKETNYSSTKILLGVSPKYDFNLQFEYENKTRIGKNITETNTNLYVNEKLVEYLDSNANEKTGKLIIYIW